MMQNHDVDQDEVDGNAGRRFRLAVMTVFLPRENLFFLEEWLNYHLLNGVEHFFLYNNEGSSSAEWGPTLSATGRTKQRVPIRHNLQWSSDSAVLSNIEVVLEPYRRHGLVTHVPWKPRTGAGTIGYDRLGAIQDYHRRFGLLSDWTAHIDIDEFLVAPASEKAVEVLDKLDQRKLDRVLLPEKCFAPRFNDQGHPQRSVLGLSKSHATLIPPMDGASLLLRNNCTESVSNWHDGDLVRINHYKYHHWELPAAAERLGVESIALDTIDTSMQRWVKPGRDLAQKLKNEMYSVTPPNPVVVPAEDPIDLGPDPFLTIGMAVYNDYDGVYFTVQSLRMHQDLHNTEILVIDNYGSEATKRFIDGLPNARYIRATSVQGTASPRDLIFRHARGDVVLCCDAHVLFMPGVIARLRHYYRDNPETPNLLQGPLLDDDLSTIWTHFLPIWYAQRWGTWGQDPRGFDPEGEPFEIGMHSLGVFSCRKASWPGFNPHFRGFGGEEGYIHEKFRQRGATTLELPFLRWVHRFGRVGVLPYRFTAEDRLRNYLIGHAELGLDIKPILQHFALQLPPDRLRTFSETILKHYAGIDLEPGEIEPVQPVFPPRPTVPKTETGGAAEDVRIIAPTRSVPRARSSTPLISCILPTFNRVPDQQYLLEEAIESFLRQDYPRKELIVLNDCAGQVLVCNAPGVRVYNIPKRYASTEEKMSAGIELSLGELIAPWIDTDISLPWRLSYALRQLGDGDRYAPGSYWKSTRGEYTAVHDAESSSAAGLISRDSALHDVQPLSVQDSRQSAEEEWFYIERASRVLNAKQRPIVNGRYVLRPHWRADYVAEAKQAASSKLQHIPR
jgi:glycosyltransferase involved in cell wall biosynthesis